MKINVVDSRSRKLRLMRPAIGAFIGVVTLTVLARSSQATGTITMGDLSGPWAMTIVGNTGCGITSMYVTFTLNTAGSGSASTTSNSSGCGSSTSSNLPFTINTLNANGSGTASLSCGTGCGWGFNIQVSPDRSMFNVVDVSNPGNYLQGMAIHQ